MRSRHRFVVSALAVALGVVGCKSTPTGNNCGSGAPPSLVGTYSLFSYAYGKASYTVPPASGALSFTATSYAYSVQLPTATGDTSAADNGSYQIIGASCIIEYSASGGRPLSGSFSLTTTSNITTLHLSVTDSSQVIAGVWTKTS